MVGFVQFVVFDIRCLLFGVSTGLGRCSLVLPAKFQSECITNSVSGPLGGRHRHFRFWSPLAHSFAPCSPSRAPRSLSPRSLARLSLARPSLAKSLSFFPRLDDATQQSGGAGGSHDDKSRAYPQCGISPYSQYWVIKNSQDWMDNHDFPKLDNHEIPIFEKNRFPNIA